MKKLYRNLFCLFIVLTTMSAQAQTKASLSALHALPAKEAMYMLIFNLAQVLGSSAEISVDFPQHFDLSTIKIAGSNDINGGFRFAVDQNKLTLKRSGLGTPVPAGKKVSVVFGPLKNPGDFKSDAFVEISFTANGQRKGVIREKIKFE